MGFLQPAAWWLLALLPVIVMIHLLRMRRARVVVPSLLLWEDAPEDVRASEPFRRLRREWVLLIQIAAFLFAILAMARPYLPLPNGEPSQIVVVIDASASMTATDVPPSRFEKARRAARELLRGRSRRTRAALIVAGTTPELAIPFTTDMDAVRARIDLLSPTDARANLRAALELAQSITARARAEVHLYSDSAPPITFSGLVPHLFRERGRNVAIVGFIAARDPANSGRFTAQASIRNFAPTVVRGYLSVRIAGRTIDTQAIDLAAQGQEIVSFEADAPKDRDVPLEAILSVSDALEADNRAYAVLPARRPLDVLAAGRPNPFRTALLGLDGDVRIETVEPDRYLPRDDVALTVFDGWAPDRLPTGDVVLIHPARETPFARYVGEAPLWVVRWNRTHPLTRFADFGQWSIREASIYELHPDVQRLVSGEAAPLIALWEDRETRVVLLTFDAFNLRVTDFALHPAAPVFFLNLLRWSREGRRVAPTAVAAGDPVPLRSHGATSMTVERPGGQRTPVGDLWTDTRRAGLYTVYADGREAGIFAVNPSPDESEIAAWDEFQPVVPSDGRPRARREIWQWFALAAIIALTAEWWLYHQRS